MSPTAEFLYASYQLGALTGDVMFLCRVLDNRRQFLASSKGLNARIEAHAHFRSFFGQYLDSGKLPPAP